MLPLTSRIAVLDDEPEMRKALVRLLRTHGFKVDTYQLGKDLLAAVLSQPPDCLLLDLHMPGVNGFDVMAALASSRSAIPIVILTGHDEPGTEARVRAFGVAAYLKKPVDEATLLSAIRIATTRTENEIGNYII